MEHCLLLVHLQVIAGDDLDQLRLTDRDELLPFDYLLEVFQHELLGLAHEVSAGVDLSKAVDAKTVGLVHVLKGRG